MKTRCISIILIILLSAACKNGEVKTTSSETIRVKVTGVTTGAISIPVHTNGILVSSEELKLSFKTGGIVANILVEEGDRVKKGDLLASLNLSEINANADQVGEMSNPYTGTYEIELILHATDFRLASGFIAGVDLFPSAKKSFSMVPVESIVEADRHQGYIYVVTGTMTVQKVRIDIETLIGSMAAVRGIPEGITEIVSEGAAYLKNGMKVDIVK